METSIESGQMSALDLLTFVTDAIYLLIFLVVARRAIRRPTPAHIDIALLFGVIVAIILEGFAASRVLPAPSPAWVAAIPGVAAMAIPFMLVRLLDDMSAVPRSVLTIAAIGFAVSALAAALSPQPYPAPVLLLLVAYLVGGSVYAGAAFARRAADAHGVTKRRMQAIAAGTLLFGAVIAVAGLATFVPAEDRFVVTVVDQVLVLLSVLAYFVGFAPPPILRRAWQEPELRAFLSRAASLPRLPRTDDIVRELERGASGAVGAEATIGLWDADRGVLRFMRKEPSTEVVEVKPSELIAGRSFALQQALFSANPPKDHPEAAEVYRRSGVGAAIAAPITTGDHRLGVLCVYAPRAPIFAESDLELVRLLADQASVILESRALLDEATRVRAQEEATRLREDFLSAAAHDLKTPLTTLVAQAQFLERRAQRDPTAAADPEGIARIVRESKRLSALVLELLDASRLDQGKLVGEREPVDLVDIARDTCDRSERCELVEEGPVVGSYDRRRIAQALENLAENALKYSAREQKVTLRVWAEGPEARILVRDHGIGIPASDVPHVFERFRRGSNVDDRRFTGMGLGLYICQGIVEQHGGRIWVESSLGEGSTFQIALPRALEPSVAAD